MPWQVDYMDVSQKQVVRMYAQSYSFLEKRVTANRALDGCQQRQRVR